MTAYDDNVLQQYADALYREAKWVAFWMAVTFGGVTFLISLAIAGGIALLPNAGINDDGANIEMIAVSVATVLGAFVGLGIGRQKAFRLKLQAQQILCQRQIEINTRALLTQDLGTRPLP